MMGLLRAAAMRLSRAGWVRAIVFPVLRRSPALAMGASNLMRRLRRELPQGDIATAAAEDRRVDLGERARRMLADIERARSAGGPR